jgi:hypothetical protein
MSLSHSRGRIVVALSCFVVVWLAVPSLVAADAKAQQALAMPEAKDIPVAQLKLAARQAAANGVATILARIMAFGNDTGLAYPPQSSFKVSGFKDVAARKVMVEEAVYKDEWKDVEQMVPELSEGMPTGRFVPGKVRTLVSRTKVGTRTNERFIPDPDGTETMKVPTYDRSGADLYEPTMLGLNGMALYVLARAGLGDHAAARKLAQTLDDRMGEFGISDHTFDVAWLAAGFAALGAESPHRDRARQLIDKLIDGQIREKGDPQGLWGPVCINYPYFAKLMEIQEQLRIELEVNLPKKLEAATPQQQATLTKQGHEMRKVSSEFTRAFRDVSSYGMRMQKITEPFMVSETVRLPGLPLYVYNRVVADVESTALAAFALAEAQRAGLLPKETERVAIRGKKVAVPEKTATALKAAVTKVAESIGSEGGCSMLTLQAVNHGFDKCRIPIHEVPYKGELPPLFNVETACSCANGLAALEWLAAVDADVAKDHDAKRQRARQRTTAIAERWYRDTAPNPRNRKPWPTVYEGISVSKAALTESERLPLPDPTSPPVDSLPWGGFGGQYAILPPLGSLFDGGDPQNTLDDGLYRQITYRLVGLQDANGQWMTSLFGGFESFSSAADALGLNKMASRVHRQLNHVPKHEFTKADPITFQTLLVHFRSHELQHGANKGGWSGGLAADRGAHATLASLMFLLHGIDEPLRLDGITIRPEGSENIEEETEADGKKPKAPRVPPSLRAVTRAERPNAERAALLDGVLAAKQIKPAAVPAAAAESVKTETETPPAPPVVAEKKDDGLGSVDDLLEVK